MKRILSLILCAVLLLAACPSFALTTAEKEQKYAAALTELEVYLEAPEDNAGVLPAIIGEFEDLDNYSQSKCLFYYSSALFQINEGTFDYKLEFYLSSLENNEKFIKYLEDLSDSPLGMPAELRAYSEGRKAEDAGDITAAIACYQKCNFFCDSADRLEVLVEGTYAEAYAEGERLLAAGELEKACKIFITCPGYKDSDAYAAFIISELGYDPSAHTEHQWVEATCTEAKYCAVCGVTEGAPKGHNWDNGTVTVAGNCVSEGEMTYTCMVCGEVKTESTGTDSNNHNWAEATVDAPKTCLWCGATEGDPLPRIQAGDYITYGNYWQSSESYKEPIKWLVLDYNSKMNRALVISRYGLDCKPYNTAYTSVTWETCTLRAWLNGEFLNAAFSAEEQKAIPTVTVNNSAGQGYDWASVGWASVNPDGGNNTQDRIFLLSYAEANKYFGVQYRNVSGAQNNTKSRAEPTAYAVKKGARKSSNDAGKTAEGGNSGWWWLRSPGYTQDNAADVRTDGSLNYRDVSNDNGSVRPAFWLDLSGI